MGVYRADLDAPRFAWSDLSDNAEGRPYLGSDCSGLPVTTDLDAK